MLLPPRPASPPNGRGLARAPEALSVESSLALARGGTCFPPPVPTRTHAKGSRLPPPSPGPGPRPSSPVARPSSPVLAPHDLVLVHDELVYIFQIKLVRHGAAAPRPAVSELPAPPQPQLPPAGNVFPPTLGRGRLPEQRKDALRRPPRGQTSLRDGAWRSRWS